MLDFIIVLLLAVSVWSGLYTMHHHQQYFASFRAHDIWSLHSDAWQYIGTSISTAFCVCDAVFRVEWLVQVGWEASGDEWAYKWLFVHAGFAVTATIFHLATDSQIKNRGKT